MLLNNLKVLLAERNLKITQVSDDTSISRTTLTALASNSSTGIQFDTLDTICLYLKITPNDFFQFYNSKLDFDIACRNNSQKTFFIEFSFMKAFYSYFINYGYGDTQHSDDGNNVLTLLNLMASPAIDKKVADIRNLPLQIFQRIEKRIIDEMLDIFNDNDITVSPKFKYEISWEYPKSHQ